MSPDKPSSVKKHKPAEMPVPVPEAGQHRPQTTPPLSPTTTPHQKWVNFKGVERGQTRKPHPSGKVWRIGTTSADWQVVSVGEGQVTFDPRKGILMQPKASAALPSEETHATLLLAKETLKHPLRNFEVTVTFTVVAQLREGKANDWETFWLMFNYTLDSKGKKQTNYVTIKPNTGVEIGRAFDEVGQEFLLTKDQPTCPVGTTHTIKVTKIGTQIAVQLDGKPAANYQSGDYPKNIYDVAGAFGVYSEDAGVIVKKPLVIKPLP